MFNRYCLTAPELLTERFLAKADRPIDVQPRYNVARAQVMPIVLQRDGAYRIEQMRWGLAPFWAKDPSQSFITARAETVAERPSSRKAIRSQRCLVPSSGF